MQIEAEAERPFSSAATAFNVLFVNDFCGFGYSLGFTTKVIR